MNETVEEQFFMNAKLNQPRIIPERLDLKNGRWYRDGYNYKVSVTTFLNIIDKGIGFMKWLGNAQSFESAMEYANERADLGSRIHTDICKLVLFNELDIKDREEEEIKRLQEFCQFWWHYNPIPFATECPIWHPDLPFAGTLDMLCHIKNKAGKMEFWLLDWKTGGIWSTYKYQLSAYKYLAELAFGIIIDRVALVQFKGSHRGSCSIGDKPKYKFIEIDPLPLDFILNIYKLFEMENPKLEPKHPVEYPDKLKLIEEIKEEKYETTENQRS